MSEKYIGMERFIFADAYNLFLKYKDMGDNDYCWERLIKEQEELYTKYNGCNMARDILNSVVAQIEMIKHNNDEYVRMNSNIMSNICNSKG